MARDSYLKSHWGNTDDNEFGRSYHTEKKLHEVYKAHTSNASSNINEQNWDEVYGGLKTADLGYGKNPFPDAKFILNTLNDKLTGNQTLNIYSQKPIQQELDKVFKTASNSIKPVAKKHNHIIYQADSMPDMEGGIRIPNFWSTAGINISNVWTAETDVNKGHCKSEFYQKDAWHVDHDNNLLGGSLGTAGETIASYSPKGVLSDTHWDESKFITLYIKQKSVHSQNSLATGVSGTSLYGGGGGGIGFVDSAVLNSSHNAYQKAIGSTSDNCFIGAPHGVDRLYCIGREFNGNSKTTATNQYIMSFNSMNYKVSLNDYSNLWQAECEWFDSQGSWTNNQHLKTNHFTLPSNYDMYVNHVNDGYDEHPYTHTFIWINQSEHGTAPSNWYNKRIVMLTHLDGYNPAIYKDEIVESKDGSYRWWTDKAKVADERIFDFRKFTNGSVYTQGNSGSRQSNVMVAEWSSDLGIGNPNSYGLNHAIATQARTQLHPQVNLQDFVLNINAPFHTIGVWDRGLLPEEMKAIMGVKYVRTDNPTPSDSGSGSSYYYYSGGNGIGENNI